MDGRHFDDLARALASPQSRRRLLKGFIAGLGAAFGDQIAGRRVPVAYALPAKDCQAFCRDLCSIGTGVPARNLDCMRDCLKTCRSCGSNQQLCQEDRLVPPQLGGEVICVDVSSNPLHCGDCHVVCEEGEQCQDGLCQSICAPPSVACHGVSGFAGCCQPNEICEQSILGALCLPACDLCETFNYETFQCDPVDCGSPCSRCENGACMPMDGTECGDACCDSGQTCCSGQCVDTQSDPGNCGVCGQLCAPGELCQNGACGCSSQSCSGECCEGACIDTQTDANNCGSCGNVCHSGQTCQNGTCEGCPSGQPDCNGTCVDTASDSNNCGGCGNACPSGQQCTNGTCGGCTGFQEGCQPWEICNNGMCVAYCPAPSGTGVHNGTFVACDVNGSVQCHCNSCGNQCNHSGGYACCSNGCQYVVTTCAGHGHRLWRWSCPGSVDT